MECPVLFQLMFTRKNLHEVPRSWRALRARTKPHAPDLHLLPGVRLQTARNMFLFICKTRDLEVDAEGPVEYPDYGYYHPLHVITAGR